MQLELDRYDRPTTTVVEVDDLPRIWSELDVQESYGFTWNNGGDEGVLIVAVEEDRCTATLLPDSTFYDLAISDAQGWVETMVLGEMVR